MLATAHLIGILVAVVATSVAMLMAMISRLRIRRPLLVWRTGPLTGVPLGPLLFLSGVAGGMTIAWYGGHSVHPILAFGYPAIGVFWFGTLWHTRAIVITEYGIIHDVLRISEAVPWGRITDYGMARTKNDGTHFIFFYRTDAGGQERIDIEVPESACDAFLCIVEHKLDNRFAMSVQQMYGRHA